MEGNNTPRGHGRISVDEPQPATSSGPAEKRRRNDESEESSAKRHAADSRGDNPRKPYTPAILHTRPHDAAKSGSGGVELKLTANYFRLLKTPTWSIYKYRVDFEPEVPMSRLRNALLVQHKPQLGGYLFDGTQVFLTKQLSPDNAPIELISTTREGVNYRLLLRYTIKVLMTDPESVQVLNLILRRATQGLHLKLVGRNYYDPNAMINLGQFNIQLWPGYQTSIRKHEHDILLNADIIHKVMRTETVYSLMQETHRMDRNNFQNSFKQKVLGMTVLTEYNNTTYRIDDVDFEKSPSDKFTRKDGEISFIEYYQQKHSITIKDGKQPLLVTKPDARALRGGRDQLVLLIPELCRVTGLSERQRTDISLKNALKPYNQMMPNIRMQRLTDYNRRIASNEESMRILGEWNLQLESHLIEIPGRLIAPQKIFFGQGRAHEAKTAGWDRECGRELRLFQPPKLARWYVVYPNALERETKKLVSRLIPICGQMGFEIREPRPLAVGNDRMMANEIDGLVKNNPELILFAVNSNNTDVYGSIKKKCYGDFSVASQVVTRRILTRDKGFDSVVTKIGIQMCSKLGGAPWLPAIPIPGVMTIGYDVSKDSQNKGLSYGALVATMDLKQGADFFSAVSSHRDSDTLSTEFSLNVIKALHAYRDKHGQVPNKIFIYRGGVGDGQIQYVRDIEVKNLEVKLKQIYAQMNQPLEMIFIIVTKRINTRIFKDRNNPQPGTVVDDVITLPERYEFFLISQSANQGTVSPTNYNVIYDTVNLAPEKVQIWTHKQAHIYYNWCGTTRVPSVMQYATKLSFLVANFMHRQPNPGLEKRLFFL